MENRKRYEHLRGVREIGELKKKHYVDSRRETLAGMSVV